MKIVRNYTDFVKKINEDLETIAAPAEEIEMGKEATEKVEDQDASNLIDEPETEAGYEEEESGEWHGEQELQKLAEMLGADVKNNEIHYEGHKIMFPSETDCFVVGNKKFDTAEEVVNFLKK